MGHRVRRLRFYPELQTLSEITVVPNSHLGTFERPIGADPTGVPGSATTLQITPAGLRPYYCLAALSSARLGHPEWLAGVDDCQWAGASALETARDSGNPSYVPIGSEPSATVAVEMPIYADGTTPTTVETRRAALIGWTGAEINPVMLLDAALKGHDRTAAVFRFHEGARSITFRAGAAPRGAQLSTVALTGHWSITIMAAADSGALFSQGNSVLVLLAGTALAAVLGVLVLVLGTGRSRALALTASRTAELRYLAYHDPLTGLPNRTFIIDRLQTMMVESWAARRREGCRSAPRH